MIRPYSTLAIVLCGSLAPSAARAITLDQMLAQMDQNAATFKSVTAHFRQVSHVEALKGEPDLAGAGTTSMKRSKKDTRVLFVFQTPDPRMVALSGNKLEDYKPKIEEVDEYDIAQYRSLVQQYLLIGFGASGKELKMQYTIRELGEETVSGQKALRIELIAKDKQVLKQFPKIELWLSEEKDKGYPVQQKAYQTAGDYQMITYSEIQINPSLQDSALKLTLPKSVKRVHPGK
jgi:outer membrane lipoprotein-sorting protein